MSAPAVSTISGGPQEQERSARDNAFALPTESRAVDAEREVVFESVPLGTGEPLVHSL